MKDFARESLLSLDQPATRLFAWPIEIMLRFQASMANTFQASTTNWAQRRQEAADEAVETFDRLLHCRDLGEAVTIQQEWIEGNIRRLDEDFSALANQTATLSRNTASSARETVGRSSNAARAGARQAEEAADSMRREGGAAQDNERPESENGGKHGRHGKRAA